MTESENAVYGDKMLDIAQLKREIIERIQKMSDEKFEKWFNSSENELTHETVDCRICRGRGYELHCPADFWSYCKSFRSTCAACKGTGKVRRRRT